MGLGGDDIGARPAAEPAGGFVHADEDAGVAVAVGVLDPDLVTLLEARLGVDFAFGGFQLGVRFVGHRASITARQRGTLSAMAVKGEPMKAKLTAQAFDDPDWIFERKLDGERAIVERTPKGVVIRSRTGRRMDNYPELTEAFAAESTPAFVVDGEIAAFDGRTTSFEKLQGRRGIADGRLARLTGIEVFIYVFDLLELEGRDVTGLQLLEA